MTTSTSSLLLTVLKGKLHLNIFYVKFKCTSILKFTIFIYNLFLPNRYSGQELRVRLGEWDVNHDVEFYPYIETDVSRVTIHPEFYAGTLFNDLAVIKLVRPVDLQRK